MFYRILSAFCLTLFLMQSPARAQDEMSDFVVRLNNLEEQVRQLTGQVEQLQYQNRQLQQELRATSSPTHDVQPGARARTPVVPPAVVPAEPARPAQPAAPGRRSDVFDPTLNPDAPGAPKPLGQTEPSRPLTEQEKLAVPAAPAGPSVAATGTGDPRAEYEEAYALFSSGKYPEAEMSFRKFLQSNPRDPKVPDAMYWLGETYLASNRPREAGEQFLALSKQYQSSPKAPSALLKLGASLTDLGAPDRACAIFAETAKKYPKASQSYKDEVAREQRRANCP